MVKKEEEEGEEEEEKKEHEGRKDKHEKCIRTRIVGSSVILTYHDRLLPCVHSSDPASMI